MRPSENQYTSIWSATPKLDIQSTDILFSSFKPESSVNIIKTIGMHPENDATLRKAQQFYMVCDSELANSSDRPN